MARVAPSNPPDPPPSALEELLRVHDHLRRAMVHFFRRHRLDDPEELAAEVFVRVLGKIGKGLAFEHSVDRYCWRVARFVRLEQFRLRKGQELSEDLPMPEKATFGLLSLETSVLMRQCLDLLSASDLDFVRRYLHEDKQELARELGTNPGAMATRFCKIKKRLQEAMQIETGNKSRDGKNSRK
jgi:DNA-directed RNA polymerase specialized sigma24 family protein